MSVGGIAAGAGAIVHPRRLIARFWRLTNFTVSRQHGATRKISPYR